MPAFDTATSFQRVMVFVQITCFSYVLVCHAFFSNSPESVQHCFGSYRWRRPAWTDLPKNLSVGCTALHIMSHHPRIQRKTVLQTPSVFVVSRVSDVRACIGRADIAVSLVCRWSGWNLFACSRYFMVCPCISNLIHHSLIGDDPTN